MRIQCTNPALLIYLVLAYVIPGSLNIFLNFQSNTYVNPQLDAAVWAYGLLMLLISISFAFSYNNSPLYHSHELNVWKFQYNHIAIVLITILVFAVLGYRSGMGHWRYNGVGLSNSLNFNSFIYVISPNILEMIMLSFLFFHYKINKLRLRVIQGLLLCCFVLTSSGIAPMLSVVVVLLWLFSPDTLRKLILTPQVQGQCINKFLYWKFLIFYSPFVLIIGLLAYIAGDAIKTNINFIDSAQSFLDQDPDVFLNYLVGRISVQWYSVKSALYYYIQLGLINALDNLVAPIENALFRFATLTGGLIDVDRPRDGSFARINYLLINIHPFNDREGTTPGLIAAFLLSFPVWLAPLVLAGYLWFYDKVQLSIRRRFAGKPTLLGELIILNITGFIFASPLDFLIIFDPVIISIIIMCFLAFSNKSKRISHASI